MADDVSIDVYRTLREVQLRYPLFLLTVAGGAVAVSINQTQLVALAWRQTPLCVAVLLWGVSFFCGCRHLVWSMAALEANLQSLRLQAGKHPGATAGPELVALALEKIDTFQRSHGDRAHRHGTLQFALFVLGTVFYIAWHVLEMYLRRVP